MGIRPEVQEQQGVDRCWVHLSGRCGKDKPSSIKSLIASLISGEEITHSTWSRIAPGEVKQMQLQNTKCRLFLWKGRHLAGEQMFCSTEHLEGSTGLSWSLGMQCVGNLTVISYLLQEWYKMITRDTSNYKIAQPQDVCSLNWQLSHS